MHRPRVRDASAVQGVYLTIGLAIAAFFPFLALYLRDAHGLDESQIGVVLALMAAARMVANPLWGHLSDTRIGRLTALQAGLAGSAAAAFMLNAAAAVPAITLVMVAQAFFMEAQEPNIDAIALEHLGEDRMSDYGRIRGWSSLTYASGCLLFGAVLQRFGIRWAMPLYAISTLLVLAWSSTVIRDRPHGLERHGRLGSVGAVFRHAPRFWGFLAAAVLVWTAFNAAWYFIGPRIEDQGRGPAPDRAGNRAGRRRGGPGDAELLPPPTPVRAAEGLHGRLHRVRPDLPSLGFGVGPDRPVGARCVRGDRFQPPVHDGSGDRRQAPAAVALFDRERRRPDGLVRDRTDPRRRARGVRLPTPGSPDPLPQRLRARARRGARRVVRARHARPQ